MADSTEAVPDCRGDLGRDVRARVRGRRRLGRARRRRNRIRRVAIRRRNLRVNECAQCRVLRGEFRVPVRRGRVETRLEGGESGSEIGGEIGVRRGESGGGGIFGLFVCERGGGRVGDCTRDKGKKEKKIFELRH